jgi:hypothetical protein
VIKKNQNTVQSNIHQAATNHPISYQNFSFFKYTQQIEALEDPKQYFQSKTTEFTYQNNSLLSRYRGKKSTGKVKQLTITNDLLPEAIQSHVYLVGTPENNAVTVGNLGLDNNKFYYNLPRFHTGIPAQLDLQTASSQMAQIDYFQKLNKKIDFSNQAYLVYLTREGHLTSWQQAIYSNYYKNIPATFAHIEHDQLNSPVGRYERTAKICAVNLEGLERQQVKTIFISDNIASGMQVAAVIKYLTDQQINPEKVIILSPLLTWYGALTMSLWAAEEYQLSLDFLASSALLDCNKPKRYFSPLSSIDKFNVFPQLQKINYLVHQDLAGKAGTRCNWTASFLAPKTAVKKSAEELEKYSESNKSLIARCKKMRTTDLVEQGVDPGLLLPYSTIKKAEQADCIDTISRYLN